MQCIFVWFSLNLFFLIGELVPNSGIFIVYEHACSIYILAKAFFSFTLSQCPQKCLHTINCYLLASVNPQVPPCPEKYLGNSFLSTTPPYHLPQPLHHSQHFLLIPWVLPAPASLVSAERVQSCPTDGREVENYTNMLPVIHRLILHRGCQIN